MIVVSGNPLHYSGVEKKHGSVGVLAKPFGERELLDAIRAVSADSDIRHPLPERKTASL